MLPSSPQYPRKHPFNLNKDQQIFSIFIKNQSSDKWIGNEIHHEEKETLAKGHIRRARGQEKRIWLADSGSSPHNWHSISIFMPPHCYTFSHMKSTGKCFLKKNSKFWRFLKFLDFFFFQKVDRWKLFCLYPYLRFWTLRGQPILWFFWVLTTFSIFSNFKILTSKFYFHAQNKVIVPLEEQFISCRDIPLTISGLSNSETLISMFTNCCFIKGALLRKPSSSHGETQTRVD